MNYLTLYNNFPGSIIRPEDNPFENLWILFAEQLNEVETVFEAMIALRSVQNMEGQQLDEIGKILGEARRGRSDSEYRIFLLIAIRKTLSNGTISEVLEIAQLILPNSDFKLREYWNTFGGFLLDGGINLDGSEFLDGTEKESAAFEISIKDVVTSPIPSRFIAGAINQIRVAGVFAKFRPIFGAFIGKTVKHFNEAVLKQTYRIISSAVQRSLLFIRQGYSVGYGLKHYNTLLGKIVNRYRYNLKYYNEASIKQVYKILSAAIHIPKLFIVKKDRFIFSLEHKNGLFFKIINKYIYSLEHRNTQLEQTNNFFKYNFSQFNKGVIDFNTKTQSQSTQPYLNGEDVLDGALMSGVLGFEPTYRFKILEVTI